jgi:hypothetical protein
MAIRMKSSRSFEWRAGQVYDDHEIPGRLKGHFLAMGWAEEVEAKDLGASPENKMMAPPDNKRRRGRPRKLKAAEPAHV